MADKRMFSKTIIDSDMFLDMPLSAQCLYFHLAMRADDDGFVNNPKKIQRMIGSNDDDLRILMLKQFIIAFETGVVVIKHWKIHNYIQKDRYRATINQSEKQLLIEDETKAYSLDTNRIHSVSSLDTNRIQTVSKLDTQYSIDKYSIDKYSIDKDTICTEQQSCSMPTVFELPLNNGSKHGITQADIDEYRALYPAVDVDQEIRKMIGWLNANPERRKTKRGIKAFVNRWLSNQQDNAPASRQKTKSYRPDSDVYDVNENPFE